MSYKVYKNIFKNVFILILLTMCFGVYGQAEQNKTTNKDESKNNEDEVIIFKGKRFKKIELFKEIKANKEKNKNETNKEKETIVKNRHSIIIKDEKYRIIGTADNGDLIISKKSKKYKGNNIFLFNESNKKLKEICYIEGTPVKRENCARYISNQLIIAINIEVPGDAPNLPSERVEALHRLEYNSVLDTYLQYAILTLYNNKILNYTVSPDLKSILTNLSYKKLYFQDLSEITEDFEVNIHDYFKLTNENKIKINYLGWVKKDKWHTNHFDDYDSIWGYISKENYLYYLFVIRRLNKKNNFNLSKLNIKNNNFALNTDEGILAYIKDMDMGKNTLYLLDLELYNTKENQKTDNLNKYLIKVTTFNNSNVKIIWAESRDSLKVVDKSTNQELKKYNLNDIKNR